MYELTKKWVCISCSGQDHWVWRKIDLFLIWVEKKEKLEFFCLGIKGMLLYIAEFVFVDSWVPYSNIFRYPYHINFMMIAFFKYVRIVWMFQAQTHILWKVKRHNLYMMGTHSPVKVEEYWELKMPTSGCISTHNSHLFQDVVFFIPKEYFQI